ncbi:hypothetical protein PRZ48_014278 [Zasmidium cellare]|uniref:Uncharacterized protein n=1 Tax=Zasmidium cellare TaxID=395010 RepID=A0ABR0E0G5_ZASCE|nr:hypothetical protein PRZ48_014278 [Zasmidium cellare]
MPFLCCQPTKSKDDANAIALEPIARPANTAQPKQTSDNADQAAMQKPSTSAGKKPVKYFNTVDHTAKKLEGELSPTKARREAERYVTYGAYDEVTPWVHEEEPDEEPNEAEASASASKKDDGW